MNQKVNLLNANLSKSGQLESDFLSDTIFGKFVITFAGRDDLILNFNEVSNTEWIQSFNTGTGESDNGGVTELSKDSEIGFSGIQ